MTLVEMFISRLDKVSGSAKGWRARCPAHDDRHPSLSIGVGDDDRVLLKCHAGCSTEAVVDALGLTMRDLMPDDAVRNNGNRRRSQRSYPTPEAAALAAAGVTRTRVGHIWSSSHPNSRGG